jgi:hypothetical protein
MTHLVFFDTVKSMMAELFPHQFVTTNTLIEGKDTKTLLRGLPSLKGPFRPLDLASLPQTPHEAFYDWL